jgi:hypothetical protein
MKPLPWCGDEGSKQPSLRAIVEWSPEEVAIVGEFVVETAGRRFWARAKIRGIAVP